MTFDEITTEICSRVNDPDQDTYGDRAEQLIHEAISALAKSGEYTKDDIPGLILAKTINTAELNLPYQIRIYGTTNDLNNNNVLKILGITDNPDRIGSPALKFIPISLEEYGRISSDSELDPLLDEVFYYEHGDYLRFFPIDRTPGNLIYVHYIKSPNDDLSGQMNGDYSKYFQYQIINFAVEKLRAEIAGA